MDPAEAVDRRHRPGAELPLPGDGSKTRTSVWRGVSQVGARPARKSSSTSSASASSRPAATSSSNCWSQALRSRIPRTRRKRGQVVRRQFLNRKLDFWDGAHVFTIPSEKPSANTAFSFTQSAPQITVRSSSAGRPLAKSSTARSTASSSADAAASSFPARGRGGRCRRVCRLGCGPR